ncbi:MAG: sugar transferase [Rhodobacteraceae bacterium]|nr:sugar transferase [Paracoccaceae bacterium]
MTIQINDLRDDLVRASAPVGLVATIRRPGFYRNVGKRVFDVAAVLVASVIVLPVVLVLAALVAMDGGRSFYTSERVGRNGRNFRMLKLRTMVPDADRMLEAYLNANPSAQLEWDRTQKLKDDPRITRLGRFLRKTSLDELPQLWNVLRGDMSLIGPRPMMPSQRILYPGYAYYALRPGVSGPWQVSDRNDCAFAKRAEYDRDYDRNMSFMTDLRIILATIAVVVLGTGY